MFKKIKLFLEELRAPFFTASIITIILGTVIAWNKTRIIHWGYFFLTLVGGVLLQAGTNVANDYFDHKSGNDQVNKEYIRPFTGGSRLIQKGLLSPREVIFESVICIIAGSVIGVYLAYQRGMPILWFGLVGVISGFFYTAPPFYWAKRVIGELLVGLNYGVLMCLGAYYVQTQSIEWPPIIASIPVGLLISAVLYINEFPDYEADRAVGKTHLVVRLGREKAIKGYILQLVIAYVIIIMGVILKIIPVSALFVFLTLPLAVNAISTLKKYYAEPMKLFPANADTVKLHLFIGLILSGSFLL